MSGHSLPLSGISVLTYHGGLGILGSWMCDFSPLLPLQKGLLWKLDFGVLVFSLLSQATVLDEWKLDPGSMAFLSDLG